MNWTISDEFARAARTAPNQAFLFVPPSATVHYATKCVILFYNEANKKITDLAERHAASGWPRPWNHAAARELAKLLRPLNRA